MNSSIIADSISRVSSITRLHAHVISMNNNLCDYFSFNMCFMSSYMNNQLIYYFITDTILTADQAEFQQYMKNCRNSLQLLEWDDASDDETFREVSIISANEKNNSDCSVSLPDYRNIKINSLNIFKLTYNSIIAQYNNWLVNLKIDFDEDLIRFSTSHQKIILISITFNEQLKTTFNSVARNISVLSYHWQKFKNWLQDVMLHESSDKLKLSKEFIITHQFLKKDLNQFYLRFFNLEI